MKSKREQKESDVLKEQNLELFAENQELRVQLEHYKWQLEQTEKQEQEIRLLHSRVRKLKHDMRNHIMVIASYLNGGEYTEARAYTSEILDRLSAVQSYVETGNSLLNHILNDKLEVARKNGIDVKAQIDRVSFARLKSIDFSAIFNNLLDNAIEACKKEQTREMSVKVYRKKGYDALSVRNRITESVLTGNPKLVTTKQERDIHGLGILQVKEIVDKNGGMYDFYEDDGFFCVNVFIPQ